MIMGFDNRLGQHTMSFSGISMVFPVRNDMSTPLRAAGPVGSVTSWLDEGFSESVRLIIAPSIWSSLSSFDWSALVYMRRGLFLWGIKINLLWDIFRDKFNYIFYKNLQYLRATQTNNNQSTHNNRQQSLTFVFLIQNTNTDLEYRVWPSSCSVLLS